MPAKRFNRPPTWPELPDDWEPGPEWEPPSSWPPAPAGWTFWVDDEEASRPAITDVETMDAKDRRRLPPLLVAGAAIIGVAAVALVVIFATGAPGTRIQTLPHTETIAPDAAAPGWRSPSYWTPLYIDFASWTVFGGIDADIRDDGESVVLHTHDTTETWRTKWSGLISPLTTTCAARIVGQVRDVSHELGVPGGFSIGLGTLEPGDPKDAELTGTAIQFDFGQRGFRTALYPTDSDHGLVTAHLDQRWHQIEVIIDAETHTLIVDGQEMAKTQTGGQCGHPFIRVWAGSAEFADFTVS